MDKIESSEALAIRRILAHVQHSDTGKFSDEEQFLAEDIAIKLDLYTSSKPSGISDADIIPGIVDAVEALVDAHGEGRDRDWADCAMDLIRLLGEKSLVENPDLFLLREKLYYRYLQDSVEIPETRVDPKQDSFGSAMRDAAAAELPKQGVSTTDFNKKRLSISASDFYEVSLPDKLSSEKMGGFVRAQTNVTGLLVQTLSGSQFAGEASLMTATVISASTKEGLEIQFNQKIGETMEEAIESVKAFISRKHPGLDRAPLVELSFEEQYIAKDGPSAGVACSLLMDSLVTGANYDPGFAVTGTIDKNGAVGSVGGIDGKIRGAVARDCTIVAIPADNEGVVRDILIMDGPAMLAQIQIMSISNYSKALDLAKLERDPNVQEALDLFADVQEQLKKHGQTAMKNPKIREQLSSVLKKLPHHLSAKYLLLYAMKKHHGKFTLAGSLTMIDRSKNPLLRFFRGDDLQTVDSLAKDQIAQSISQLNRVRPQLDDRTRPYADAIIDFATVIRKAVNDPPDSPRMIQELLQNIESSGAKVDYEQRTLFTRVDVQEELKFFDEDEDEDDEDDE